MVIAGRTSNFCVVWRVFLVMQVLVLHSHSNKYIPCSFSWALPPLNVTYSTLLGLQLWFTCKRLLLECFRVIALPSSKKQSTGDHFSEGAQVWTSPLSYFSARAVNVAFRMWKTRQGFVDRECLRRRQASRAEITFGLALGGKCQFWHQIEWIHICGYPS